MLVGILFYLTICTKYSPQVDFPARLAATSAAGAAGAAATTAAATTAAPNLNSTTGKSHGVRAAPGSAAAALALATVLFARAV